MRICFPGLTTVMTPPRDERSPIRPIAFRKGRFIAVLLVLVVVGVALVDGFQPERRMRTVETVAEIQIRVVPKFAPTTEALERRILSGGFLQGAWDDINHESSTGARRTPSAERDADFKLWRSRLHIELDGEAIDEYRFVRVIWSGLDDLSVGAAVVESLAQQYADEISADRWYDSVDRLRAKVKAVESASGSASTLKTATRDLQLQMDEMLLPREAEFPVVTLDRVGMHVGHLRPIWYAGVAVLSLSIAAIVSVRKTTFVESAPVPAAPEPTTAERSSAAIESPNVAPIASTHQSPPQSDYGVEIEQAEIETATHFESAADVESRLAAPVLAVVSRSRRRARHDRQVGHRRAA